MTKTLGFGITVMTSVCMKYICPWLFLGSWSCALLHEPSHKPASVDPSPAAQPTAARMAPFVFRSPPSELNVDLIVGVHERSNLSLYSIRNGATEPIATFYNEPGWRAAGILTYSGRYFFGYQRKNGPRISAALHSPLEHSWVMDLETGEVKDLSTAREVMRCSSSDGFEPKALEDSVLFECLNTDGPSELIAATWDGYRTVTRDSSFMGVEFLRAREGDFVIRICNRPGDGCYRRGNVYGTELATVGGLMDSDSLRGMFPNGDILVVHPDAEDLESPPEFSVLRITPDGRRIAIASARGWSVDGSPGGTFLSLPLGDDFDDDLVRFASDNGDRDHVLSTAWGIWWSPIEAHVAYHRMSDSALVLLDLATGVQRSLPSIGNFVSSWSADGRLLRIEPTQIVDAVTGQVLDVPLPEIRAGASAYVMFRQAAQIGHEVFGR